jgi:hypothetical protein
MRPKLKTKLKTLDAVERYLRSPDGIPVFHWRILSYEEIDNLNLRNPPCEVLRGDLGVFQVEIDEDGETALLTCVEGAQRLLVLTNLDMGKPADEIVRDIFTYLDEVRSQNIQADASPPA